MCKRFGKHCASVSSVLLLAHSNKYMHGNLYQRVTRKIFVTLGPYLLVIIIHLVAVRLIYKRWCIILEVFATSLKDEEIWLFDSTGSLLDVSTCELLSDNSAIFSLCMMSSAVEFT